MQRRILLIAIVFLGCLGLGYGATWLIVGPPKEVPAPQAAAALEMEPLDEGNEPIEAEADTEVAKPEEVEKVEVAAEEPAKVAEVPTAPSEGEAAVAAEATVQVDVAAQPAEWERCYKRTCRIDFGQLGGGISLRKGTLEHGQEIEWERDFARADKVGSLDAGKRTTVEVLAIGLTNGEPAAALVSRKLKKKTQVGVLALKIGDRQLRLVPLD